MDREEETKAINALVEQLKGINDLLEEAGPVFLPEVQRFLNNCKPLAEALFGYFMSGSMQRVTELNLSKQILLTLLQRGEPCNSTLVQTARLLARQLLAESGVFDQGE